MTERHFDRVHISTNTGLVEGDGQHIFQFFQSLAPAFYVNKPKESDNLHQPVEVFVSQRFTCDEIDIIPPDPILQSCSGSEIYHTWPAGIPFKLSFQTQPAKLSDELVDILQQLHEQKRNAPSKTVQHALSVAIDSVVLALEANDLEEEHHHGI